MMKIYFLHNESGDSVVVSETVPTEPHTSAANTDLLNTYYGKDDILKLLANFNNSNK